MTVLILWLVQNSSDRPNMLWTRALQSFIDRGYQWFFNTHVGYNILRSHSPVEFFIPAETRCKNNIIMMSKQRRFDVIMTLLCSVPVGIALALGLQYCFCFWKLYSWVTQLYFMLCQETKRHSCFSVAGSRICCRKYCAIQDESELEQNYKDVMTNVPIPGLYHMVALTLKCLEIFWVFLLAKLKNGIISKMLSLTQCCQKRPLKL